MANISDLSDELLVKILSFLPTKVAVSTTVLSKQWEFLWMWLPKLEFYFRYRSESSAWLTDFIDKNLPLHKAHIIESLRLHSLYGKLHPEDLKPWVGIAVSRCVRELSIHLSPAMKPAVSMPSSLYSCNSLVTLKLDGQMILVDVPRMVCLPSLKTLQLGCVTYSNDDSLRLLLSYCPVLEDLFIDREGYDNVRKLVIIVPSLQRLTLIIDQDCSSDGYVMVTPSLKYFKVDDYRSESSCLIEHMPELEKANISLMLDIEKHTERLLKSITTVKRLTLRMTFNSGEETVYPDGIVFSQLENLKVYICSENWSKLLVHLLKDSPQLRILDLEVDNVSWSKNQGSVPKNFLNCLESGLTKRISGSSSFPCVTTQGVSR
ncbi:putative FBD-associated F-box protein At5g56700 isoform X2 [Arabidopsis lyrata subsp. lyrata]|uniref:putative FBD-associated F-box protein At5g56700 isoform X2 n=1 Tax=Arabidopsis lyrata subsp. lyrata TaxID=81972 RepID=UPI000A29D8E4|nr:putative FBD-associated F-box protein At5g56700 isoform X2 [Arabidopsis lyrata subsp. lyrata]|eukprot:XP_020865818.1 putative FBD-associated F-box protein At5g56700 isoform X2 [Arabidopsis lyrata subsp. lyrata]